MRDVLRREGSENAFLILLRAAPCADKALESSPSVSPAHTSGKVVSSAVSVSKWDSICNEFSDVFEEPPSVPQRDVKHRIVLADESLAPPKPRQYRMSEAELREVRT